jgi:hypothetical protein
MGGDFGTVIKNSKLFRFRHDFEVYFRENFELVHAEPAKIQTKIKSIIVLFEPICKFPKQLFKIFTLWDFLLVLKNSKYFSFLPHTQHAYAFCYRMLNMHRH